MHDIKAFAVPPQAYALGDLSGANFNLAVTVALLASGRLPDMTDAKASIYVLVQIVAGIAASFS